MARAKKAAPVVEEEVETRTGGGGRTPDPVRYEMYAEWLVENKGIDHEPQALQDAIVHYHEFQRSDVNKEYNQARRDKREEEAEARRQRRLEREQAKGAETPAAKPARGRRAKAEAEEVEETTPAKRPARKRAPRKTAAAV